MTDVPTSGSDPRRIPDDADAGASAGPGVTGSADDPHDPPSMERWHAIFNVVVAGTFFHVVVLALIAAFGWNESGRRVPVIVLYPTVILSAFVLIGEIRQLRLVLAEHRAWAAESDGKTPVDPDPDADPMGLPDVKAVLWLGFFTALVLGLGALIGTAVFSMIFLRAREESWLLTIVYSLTVPLVLHVLFTVLLGVRTYSGFLGWI